MCITEINVSINYFMESYPEMTPNTLILWEFSTILYLECSKISHWVIPWSIHFFSQSNKYVLEWIFNTRKYRIAYRIAASVSRYVSYRELVYRCTPKIYDWWNPQMPLQERDKHLCKYNKTKDERNIFASITKPKTKYTASLEMQSNFWSRKSKITFS